MKGGYTAAELELLRLPGMPRHARGIRLLAQRQGWSFTERELPTGKAYVYPVEALPAEAQVALLKSDVGNATQCDDFAKASEAHRAIARDRVSKVLEVRARILRGDEALEAYRVVGGEQWRTLQRWYHVVRNASEADWPSLLLPKWQSGKGESRAECHPDAWAYIKSDYLRGSRAAFAACYRRMKAVAKAKGWTPIPSETALRRRLERDVPVTAKVLHREGPDALKRLYPAQERDKSGLCAMQLVNADGHLFDVMVLWPDGTVARPHMVGFQDIYSGKILSWRVDRTENKDLVRLAFADCVTRFGVPDAVYLDNGRAFANKWLTGGSNFRFRFKVLPEDPVGVMQQLNVSVHWTTPYHGQAKPIERAWRDLCESISRHPAFEGAYVGSNPTVKPHNYDKDNAVPLAEFLRTAAALVDEHNARDGRRSKVCGGRSIDAAFDASYRTSIVRRVTEAQRRLLFLGATGIKVRKGTGQLHLLDSSFFAEELIALQGQKVICRFDPQNIHAGLYVYTLEGTYLAFAELTHRGDFKSQNDANAHGRARSAWMKAQKALAAAEQTLEASELAAMHLEAIGAAKPAPKPAVVRGSFGTPSAAPGELPVPVTVEEPAERTAKHRERGDFVLELAGAGLNQLPRRRAVNDP